MKNTAITLTADQLFFLSQHLIKAQLKYPSLVKAYCLTFCEDEAEISEQMTWHTEMLQELASVEPIASLNSAIRKAIEEFI
jgi:hypothetical protein